MLNQTVKSPSSKEVALDLLNIKNSMIDDADKIITFLAIRRNKLQGMKPLWFLINEICTCLITKKQCAAMTLTNHLLESSIKLALILWNADLKDADSTKDFAVMYKDEIKDYQGKEMSENLTSALECELITKKEYKDLSELKLEYRHHISHASNNKYIRNVKTTIMTYDTATSESSEKQVGVTGNPILNLLAQESFMRQNAEGYFMHVYSYIMIWDAKIHQHYLSKNK